VIRAHYRPVMETAVLFIGMWFSKAAYFARSWGVTICDNLQNG
jgi:hypothetical protein